MVSACKSHITEQGDLCVWDVPSDELMKRFQACHRLFQFYQDCFEHAKERAAKTSRNFEVSEMYVFGKFGSFCQRLIQIKEMVELIQHFSVLKESHIEGIDTLATRYTHMVTAIKKKPYNPLDHRKLEFVSDYEDFLRQMCNLEDQLSSFMGVTFSHVSSTMQSLWLLRRSDK